MKKTNIILLITAFVLFLFISGCNKPRIPVSSTDLQPKLKAFSYTPHPPATGNNYFALDLYSELKKTETGNIFFSPFSIFSALSMTGEGARNETWNEMKTVLHLQEDNNTRWNAFLQLINTINDPAKDYQLKTANKLWLEQTMTFLPEYLNTVQTYYLAGLANLDFINYPEPSRITINDWVEQQTEGKIKYLLPPGSINPLTRLVLTNAIYFKAEWLNKFRADDTLGEGFTISPGNTIQVQMMHMKVYGIVEDYFGKARVLELPYKGNEVSMFIFLPEQGEMAELENNMTIDKINSWMAARGPGGNIRVILALPKFKVETTYDLNVVLSNMGMPAAFDKDNADFSGMKENLFPRLYISKVVHKAFVAVDEEGTEAAAATGVIIAEATGVIPSVPFTVDHPFMFLICENTTNAILFMGRVNEPGAN